MNRALVLAALLALAMLPPHASAANASVSISGFAFRPNSVTVNVGETVAWTNNDGEAHTATADDGAFDTSVISNGQTRSVTFATPGSFGYHCAIHPSMRSTVVVTSTPPPTQLPPVARFTLSMLDLDASADSSASSDPDGQIVNRSWDWGDGATSYGTVATHAYRAPGDYRVVLVVRDDQRLTDQANQTAHAQEPAPPVASLRLTNAGLTVTANATGTTSNLTLITTRWRFGDGATLACDDQLACSASGPGRSSIVPGKRVATHAYQRGGDFDVTLFVRDGRDRDAQTTGTVTIVDPRPVPIVIGIANSTATFDASLLTRYGNATFAWTFGDGKTGSGEVATHEYPHAGRWNVTLQMTDEAGTQEVRQEANVGPFPPDVSTPAPAPAPAPAKSLPTPGAWAALAAIGAAFAMRRKLGPESPK